MSILSTDLDARKVLQKKVKRALSANSDDFVGRIVAILEVGTQFSNLKKDEPTPREEANAITAFCFRNQTILENLHSGDRPFDNAAMGVLMVESSTFLTQWLIMRDTLSSGTGFTELYYIIVHAYNAMYTTQWIGTKAI